MPSPRTGNDLIEFAKLGLPPKFGLDLLGAGYENSRISRTALTLLHSYGTARNSPHRVDDFAHGEALPAAEVIDEP
jgi:hypothetical protein